MGHLVVGLSGQRHRFDPSSVHVRFVADEVAPNALPICREFFHRLCINLPIHRVVTQSDADCGIYLNRRLNDDTDFETLKSPESILDRYAPSFED